MAWAGVGEERIINVGNGVGLPFSTEGPRHMPGYPYLLYVGSRKPHKNLPRLLEAFSVSGVRKDVRLVLNGGPDRSISEIIDRFKLNGDVVFLDSSADSDLSDIYRGALGFVFPSLYEGFGLPPVEAMACGVPVLTSNVCSLPEVTGDAAILVNPESVEAIANGIKQLVSDSALRQELKRRGLSRAKIFSWDETAKKTQTALLNAVTSQ